MAQLPGTHEHRRCAEDSWCIRKVRGAGTPKGLPVELRRAKPLEQTPSRRFNEGGWVRSVTSENVSRTLWRSHCDEDFAKRWRDFQSDRSGGTGLDAAGRQSNFPDHPSRVIDRVEVNGLPTQRESSLRRHPVSRMNATSGAIGAYRSVVPTGFWPACSSRVSLKRTASWRNAAASSFFSAAGVRNAGCSRSTGKAARASLMSSRDS